MLSEPIAVTLQVIHILEELNMPYFIGGSLATAIHGVGRATMDVDLVAAIELAHVSAFVEALGGDFYADQEMIRNALTNQMSFNLVHKKSMFKVDIFPQKDRPFDKSQFERRVAIQLSEDSEHRAWVASPEDLILAKLEWYRLGGEVSDRQWGDILTVVQMQGTQLDLAYLNAWAGKLGVEDLLPKALERLG